MTALREELARASPFQQYAYAYPHKTAYRALDPPVSLEAMWRDEPRHSLFLYVHVPFCEFRCGFCNLFTTTSPGESLVASYLDALERHARAARSAIGPARYARLALGGGTPTHLPLEALERIFDLVADTFEAPLGVIPVSVELSPDTATREKLALLRARGTTRESLGVQTYDEAEARAVSRPQRTASVEAALDAIRAEGFPVLNVDLIYGLPGQTRASWLASVRRALRVRPEELYLYPLYVRPLTGLGLAGKEPGDERLDLLRAARDLLEAEGYEAVSLRLFQRRGAEATPGPVYCCQEDGMLGLGAGARSYTRRLHTSTEWATAAPSVKAILEAYVRTSEAEFGCVRHGFHLDADEERRRYAIQSLLQRDGLDRSAYGRRFGTDPLRDLPGLGPLLDLGWAEASPERLVLSRAGLERSDLIGPWLASENVRRLMAEHERR